MCVCEIEYRKKTCLHCAIFYWLYKYTVKAYNDGMPPVVAIVLIVAIFSVPVVFLLGPAIGALAPLLYIGAGIFGAKYLLDLRHKQKMLELDKQREVEELAYRHLQAADQVIDDEVDD